MAKHTYTLECFDPGTQKWFMLMREGLEFSRGYLVAHREAPGPRLAMRIARDDGRIMAEVNGSTEVSIGMIAGWPSWQQYARAAERALIRAAHTATTMSRDEGDTSAIEASLRAHAAGVGLILRSTGNVAGG